MVAAEGKGYIEGTFGACRESILAALRQRQVYRKRTGPTPSK